jgi:uncharacterized protein YabE (DUF348 family)
MGSRTKQFKKRVHAAGQRHVKRVKRLAKKPLFTIPFVTFVVLLAVGVTALVATNGGTPKFQPNNSNIVIVSHDKTQQTVPTRAKTVGELLEKLNITLNSGDVVEPGKTTPIIGDNFRINVYRAVPVTVIDGATKTFTYSAAQTPRSIVKQAGVTVYPEDDLTLAPTQNFLTDSSIGDRLVINRATPVNVNLFGTPVVMRTHAQTVGDLLKEKNISLGDGDSVQPSASTTLTSDMQVFLIRKGKQVVSEQQAIAAPQQVVEDASLSFGTTVVRQQGAAGVKVVTYELDLQNGVEVARRQIQEVVTQQPVTEIIARGKAVSIPSDKQAVMALAGIGSGNYAYVDYIVSHESGWCPTKVQGQSGSCPAYAPATIPTNLGYGLGQATPGTKMATFGSDWKTSAVTQLKWANNYAVSRYGSWAAAYNHKVSAGWW